MNNWESRIKKWAVVLLFLPIFSMADLLNLVLLPIETSDDIRQYETEFGSALQEGLRSRYTVFYGSAVEKELEKEYSKLDCTAESCNQNVAIAFNGELIADGSVKRTSSGFILKMVITNVLTGEVVDSTTEPCRGCDELDVLDALKSIGSKGAQVSANSSVGTIGAPATLMFDSTPTGARVKIDGISRGMTPFLSDNFSVGQSVQIELELTDFENQVLDVTLDKKLNVLDGIAMVSASKNISQAVLMFDSIPSSASIYINDRYIGITPYQSLEHFVGERLNLRLELEGYQTKSEVVVVSQQVLELQSFNLEELESASGDASVRFIGDARFQKLDEDGNETTNENAACLQDNQTALVWELQGMEDGSFSFDEAKSLAEKRNKGGFFKKSGACGLNDWRLPTKLELVTLLMAKDELTDSSYPVPRNGPMYYWSTDAESPGTSVTVGYGEDSLVRQSSRKNTKKGAVLLVSNGFNPGVKLKMISIPGGTFEMGDMTGNDWNALPVHKVTVKPFMLSQTEVTNGLWDQCAQSGSCKQRFPRQVPVCDPLGQDLRRYGSANCRIAINDDFYPVHNVDWYDIQNFIDWYSKKMKKTYRLPSEAEFEYALRAGTSTQWYWGRDPRGANRHENCKNDPCAKEFNYTAPVASFEPNAFGLYDMAGNVSEWVQDCENNGDYFGAPTDGSAWEESNCNSRVSRGGGISNGTDSLSSHERDFYGTLQARGFDGFRLALDK